MEELAFNQPTLNPLVFHQVFPHITEQIFEKMNDKSLKNCREVAKSWQISIDNRNILWNKIAKKNDNKTKTFQLACENGHFKMANMLIKKAKEFKIDVNVKNKNDDTPFHLAYTNGNFEITNMLLLKSAEINIDLNAKDKAGFTPFHYACACAYACHTKTVKILVQKSAELSIDLNAANEDGLTPFHVACGYGATKTAKMLMQKSTEFNIDVNQNS